MAARNPSDAKLERLYTPATVFMAEGARVGIVTCLQCCAAILLDERDGIDALEKHADWHAENAALVNLSVEKSDGC